MLLHLNSCYTVYPDCLGCSGTQVCCCISNEVITLKPSKDPEAYCLLIEDSVTIIPCKVCMKVIRSRAFLSIQISWLFTPYNFVFAQARTQICCMDMRMSIPCDAEIPCMFNFLFMTCCYKNKCNCKCCSKIGDIESSYQASQSA